MPDKEWYDAPPKAEAFFQRLFTTPYCTMLEFDVPVHFHPKRRRVLPTVYFTKDRGVIESYRPPRT
jgi:hypothetical protein